MSDPGRKAFSTKLKEGLVPKIFKSKGTRVVESATDASDRAAREGVPDQNKCTTQAIADKAGRAKDRLLHGSSGKKTGHDLKKLFSRKRSHKAKP